MADAFASWFLAGCIGGRLALSPIAPQHNFFKSGLNDESGESVASGKTRFILAFAIAFLFVPFSFAAEGCSDLFRFDYASSAVMPILGQDVSPGGSVVAVRSL